MDDIAGTIGKRIRTRRVLLEMTQQELADAVRVHQTTVSQWERGDYCPSRRHEARILDALDAHGTGLFEVHRRGVA